jgi:phosphatidylglycerophosphate synthase
VPGFRVPNWLVVLVVGKDLWVVAGFLVIYLVTDRFRVHPTWTGKTCTFGQLAMVASVLAAPDLEHAARRLGTGLVTVTQWGVAGLCVAAVISYTRLGLGFIAKEQKPLEDSPLHAPAKGGREDGKKDVASHDESH